MKDRARKLLEKVKIKIAFFWWLRERLRRRGKAP